MSHATILVPVDGASNIKLEVFDFETLTTVHSLVTDSPTAEHDGLAYNDTGREFDWFDSAIQSVSDKHRNAAVVAPVARGASGGLVGDNNSLVEVPGRRLTLAYTQVYPEKVDEKFSSLAGSSEQFFLETGSIRDLPGSLTLLKRFVFEETMRPQLLERASGFAHYGALMGGHFLGDNYRLAIRRCGNEHSYWMCHTGARDVCHLDARQSRAARSIQSFQQLVPREASVCYHSLGEMPTEQAIHLKLSSTPEVTCGGHDTCLSHIPVLSTFYQAFPSALDTPVLHVEAGTWTMIAQIGGMPKLPGDGYKRDIIIQGTIDGAPVVTARYGGGADFSYLKKLASDRGHGFVKDWTEAGLLKFLQEADCFVLPNMDPAFHQTGPFPEVKGRILNEALFFSDGVVAYLASQLATALATASQVAAVSPDPAVPMVLTAGGSTDALFGSLLATLTGRSAYALFDQSGQAVSETTTLGAAIVGKAACLAMHPYHVDMRSLGMNYRAIRSLPDELARALKTYRSKWAQHLDVR